MKTRTQTFMKNAKENAVSLHPFGAALRSVFVPDRYGNTANVVMCPQSWPPAKNDGSYAGATLAPCAGRIREGQMWIGDQCHQLSINDGVHHLHGGINSLSNEYWKESAIVLRSNAQSIRFSATSENGRDGYPGERHFQVQYTWDDENQLTILLHAESNQATWVNLSNHAYWNLSGNFSTSALDMTLQINASFVYSFDADFLPVQSISVENTPFDFRQPKPLRMTMDAFAGNKQLHRCRGYNHAFLLDGSQPSATLTDLRSGRRLRLYTDYPALMLYSGGFLDETTMLTGLIPATPGCAIALEPQELPCLSHREDTQHSACFLLPGDIKKRWIQYRFDTI